MPIEEIEKLAKNKNLPMAERLKAIAELKFLKLRNRQKRVEMSSASSYTGAMATTPAPHPSVMDPVPRRRPRYRWRTWMRGHLPWALVDLFPKGLGDCGQHEWHNYDDKVDRCYHCEVGVRPHRPIHAPIDDKFRLMLVRAAERGDEVAAELVERFHERDRELGRARWNPPAA